jgi:hypothetical protein
MNVSEGGIFLVSTRVMKVAVVSSEILVSPELQYYLGKSYEPGILSYIGDKKGVGGT